MSSEARVRVSLVLIRASVFLVMFIWTLDKFLNPGHASTVYETFYFIGGLGPTAMYAVGGVELLLLIAFVCGVQKRVTYGAVLLLHAISTFSSYKQYLAPYDGPNILFFAAWPMLAACAALYMLRDRDTAWVIPTRS